MRRIGVLAIAVMVIMALAFTVGCDNGGSGEGGGAAATDATTATTVSGANITVNGWVNQDGTGLNYTFKSTVARLRSISSGFARQSFTVIIVRQPQNGKLSKGNTRYTLNANFVGTDSFQFKVQDAQGNQSGVYKVTFKKVDADPPTLGSAGGAIPLIAPAPNTNFWSLVFTGDPVSIPSSAFTFATTATDPPVVVSYPPAPGHLVLSIDGTGLNNLGWLCTIDLSQIKDEAGNEAVWVGPNPAIPQDSGNFAS